MTCEKPAQFHDPPRTRRATFLRVSLTPRVGGVVCLLRLVQLMQGMHLIKRGASNKGGVAGLRGTHKPIPCVAMYLEAQTA